MDKSVRGFLFVWNWRRVNYSGCDFELSFLLVCKRLGVNEV